MVWEYKTNSGHKATIASGSVARAMAAGVAVLATRCPTGPEEIITPGVDGELCEIAVDSLTEHIEKLGASSSLREKLAEGGTKRIADFDLSRIIDKYERFFLSLL